MKTVMMLLMMYENRAVIPADRVAADWFDLSLDRFLRKQSSGSIPLPLIQMEGSRKSFKGVHVQDLTDYIDRKAAEARDDLQKLVA
mgnify:CR=1 FL=1